MSRRRKILNDLMECKAQGLCERDKIVNAHMEGAMLWQLQMRQVTLEAARKRADLPPCAPDCSKPIMIEAEVI